MTCNFFKIKFLTLSLIFLILFSQNIGAKISDKNAIKTFWQEAPIMPGAAKYFIRTEKIEKKTRNLNNHPIKISPQILRKMLKQLSYKYDRENPEIPLFSNKELLLLSEHVPNALRTAKSNEDITFVIKGKHKSARWSFSEDRLTSGRLFVSNNQLNLILGSVQVNLQPTLDERYQGNVWETAKLVYDIGHRRKQAKFEGLIIVFNQNEKGIFRKSSERKDWFIFTNTAYKQAKEDIDTKEMSKEQYKSLQQQIDTLQKKLNTQPRERRNVKPTPPPTRNYVQPKKRVNKTPKQEMNNDNSHVLEQRLKTIENLHKKGILSDQEYQKKRDEILKGI